MTRTYFAAAVLTLALAAPAAAAPAVSDWGEGQKIDDIPGNHPDLNTRSLDGCPILSPDGLRLFMASNRPRYEGDPRTDLDIWVATRASREEPFGAPENLPAPVNSSANDFCPTPLRGGHLLFVSNRTTGESCGMGDIYLTRLDRNKGWRDPRHLACAPDGPNSPLDEQGPSVVEIADGVTQLFFSRSSPVVKGDLFVSTSSDGEGFGSAAAIAELNSPENDIQPNVRKDGREIVFSSNYAHPGAQGGQDIYTATRASVHGPWSAPVNVGTGVNKAQNETRPSLSWDARTLLFGRAPGPEGSSDIYMSTR